MATVDLNELRQRHEFIKERRHPTLPLIIWNYNARCQYAKAWDEYTRMARGLITDLEGNIVARPFRKFFNLGETEETKIENLPDEMPYIYEKLDGSLGILYWDESDGVSIPYIASRGSFVSRQAQWATEWLQERARNRRMRFVRGYTYLFEIIYPGNRIVVDYGDREGLALLAVVETVTGQEMDPIDEAHRLGLPGARQICHPLELVQSRCETLDANEEGFVAHYPGAGLRVKLKGAEYCRLHKLLTGFSTISIWECLVAGTDIEPMLDRVPEEFSTWVRQKKDRLEERFADYLQDAKIAVSEVLCLADRKAQALYLQDHHADIQHLAFMILNGKDPAPLIWKRLRPEHALPFQAEPPEESDAE